MDFQDRSDDEDLWAVIEITGETTLKYKISWAGLDPATGKPWPQDWIPKKDVTNDLVDAWRAKGNKAKGRRESSSPAWKGPVQREKRRRSVMKEATDDEDEEDRNDNVITVRKGSWINGWQADQSVSASSKTTQPASFSPTPDGKDRRLHFRSRAATKANAAFFKSSQAMPRASTPSSAVQCMRKRPSSPEDELDLLSKRRKIDTSHTPSNAGSIMQNKSVHQRDPELHLRTPDPLFLQSDSPEPERELSTTHNDLDTAGCYRDQARQSLASEDSLATYREGYDKNPRPTSLPSTHDFSKLPYTRNSGVESTKDMLPGPAIPRPELIRALTLGLAETGIHVALNLDGDPIVQGSSKETLDSQETRHLDQTVRECASGTTNCSAASSDPQSDEDSTASEGSVGIENAQTDKVVVDGSVASVGEGMPADHDALDSSKAPFLELQDADTDDEEACLIHFDAGKNDRITSSLQQECPATVSDPSGRTAEHQVDDTYKRSEAGSQEPLRPPVTSIVAGGYRLEEAPTKYLEQIEVGAADARRSDENVEENARDEILDMELQYPEDDELEDVHADPTSSHAEETIRDLQRQLSEKAAELAEKDAQISQLRSCSAAEKMSTLTPASSVASNTVLQTPSCTSFLEQRIAWLEDDAKRWRQAAEFIIRKDEVSAESDKRELERVKGELSEMRARAEKAERLLASMRSEEGKRLASAPVQDETTKV